MSVIYLLSKEASVRKVGGRLRVERGCEVLQSVPIHDVTCLVASRCAHVSMPVIFDLMDVHAGIFFVDGRGRIVGQVEGKALSWERSQRQARMFADAEMQAELIRQILREKMTEEMKILKLYARKRSNETLAKLAREIQNYRAHLARESEPNVLRGLEGMAARMYFDGFPEILDEKLWPWHGRNRRPPRDPVNALLSYGYAFLEREVRLAVIGAGLDGRIGFLHANNGRKDSLIFDLMELFRQPLIDRLVLKLLNRGQFRPEAFEVSDELGCRLTLAGRREWIADYETFMCRPYQEYGGRTPRVWLQQRVQVFAGELAALAFAVGGYRAWAHLTAPGYFLLRTLGEMDPAAQATRFPWRCKHASFVRVLDDEVLAAASVAIAHGRLLSFVYHGRAVTALPWRIVTSWADGRQRVEALVRRSAHAARFTVAQTYRAEEMMGSRRGRMWERCRLLQRSSCRIRAAFSRGCGCSIPMRKSSRARTACASA